MKPRQLIRHVLNTHSTTPSLAHATQAFAEHIKWCANKLQLGVSFMPNTPCYERVVEMQVGPGSTLNITSVTLFLILYKVLIL